MSIDSRLAELTFEAESKRQLGGWSTIFPVVGELLKEDMITNVIVPVERLDKYRNIFGGPTLLRELVNNGMKSDMPESYQRYMLSDMRPSMLVILQATEYVCTKAELNRYLTHERWIQDTTSYDNTLKLIFKDNSIMLNKWQRYAEGVRSL